MKETLSSITNKEIVQSIAINYTEFLGMSYPLWEVVEKEMGHKLRR